jgi:hypothetical protein
MNFFYNFLKVVHSVVSIFCPEEKRKHLVSTDELPWFWVGGVLNNKTICITDIVNRSVTYSTVVTPQYLSEISGIDMGIKWKYIDVITLEEKYFPPEGIVIENASDSIYDSE